MPESMGVFRHFALPLSEIAPVQAKVKNLKNTVWKTPFGTLWSKWYFSVFAFKNVLKYCETFARYRGHLGTSGPKLQIESENEFPGPLGPGPKKSPRRNAASQLKR